MRLSNIIPFLVFMALAWTLAYTTNLANNPRMMPNMIGKKLESFKTQEVFTHKPFASDELSKEISIMNLWASWCVSCQAEHKTMSELSKKGYKIYGMNVGDRPEDAKKYLEKNGNPYFKILSDPKREIAIALGATGTPETYVIGKDGKIYFHHRGYVDQQMMNTQLIPIIEELKKRN